MIQDNYACRWKRAATWYNSELDRMASEGLTPQQASEASAQLLLIHNVLALHAREIAADPPMIEVLCKVFVKARISELLIAATLQAFSIEYGLKSSGLN